MFQYFIIAMIAITSTSCRNIVFSNDDRRYDTFSGLPADTTAIRLATDTEFASYDIHDHDTIADIGFHYGSIEGALILRYDSLCIYAEDYNTPARNEAVIYRTFDKYAAMRKDAKSSQIKIFRGDEKSTGLPNSTFDKVLVRKTLHHISNKDVMLEDIKRIMKPNARLYIMEPSKDTSYFESACHATIMGKPIIVELLSKHGFVLISQHTMLNNKNDAAPWVTGMVEIPFTVYTFSKRL